MSQSISRRSFLKCAGSGAVSLAAALLTGVSAAAQQPRLAGEPALLDGKAAVELLGYAPAPEMGNVLVYLSVENLSASSLPVDASYLQSREVRTLADLYSMGTGFSAVCDGTAVRCGSFAAPLYGENAADASVFTLNLAAGRGALVHCFCAVPENWQTLERDLHGAPRHRRGGPGRCALLPRRGGQRGGPVKEPSQAAGFLQGAGSSAPQVDGICQDGSGTHECVPYTRAERTQNARKAICDG